MSFCTDPLRPKSDGKLRVMIFDCGCYLQQMFSGRKLRVDLAESSGGDRERGDNAGRSGQFAVVVTKLVFVTLFSLL